MTEEWGSKIDVTGPIPSEYERFMRMVEEEADRWDLCILTGKPYPEPKWSWGVRLREWIAGKLVALANRVSVHRWYKESDR